MSKIETLGSQLGNQNGSLEKRQADNGLSVVKIETPANPKEKPKPTKENKDYVITLDIGDKNRDFRDKQNQFKNFWENAKAVLSSGKKNLEGSKTGTAKIFDLEQRTETTAEKNETVGQQVAEQRIELAAIETGLPQPRTPEQKTETGNQGAEVLYELPSDLRAQMSAAADMIKLASPRVEGGYGDVVSGLESGILDFANKEKAAVVINTLLKEHRWQGENLANLNAVLKSLEQDLGARKFDFEQAAKQQGSGEAQEGRDEDIIKRQAYTKFSELIKKVYGLSGEQAKFVNEFINSDSHNRRTIRTTLTAINGIKKKTDKLTEADRKLLGEVENFIKQEWK